MSWTISVILGVAAAAMMLTGCGEQAEPATDRTIVGTWELDTRVMTEEAVQRVELRLREQARNARPPRQGAAEGGNQGANPEGGNANNAEDDRPAQPAANPEAAGPSPAEINAAKEKERARLAGMGTSLSIRPDGTYLAEYTTKEGDRETRRIVIGEWTLAAGVLVLKETEVVLDTEGQTATSSRRYQAERARLAAITLRGTPPGDVQEILRRR